MAENTAFSYGFATISFKVEMTDAYRTLFIHSLRYLKVIRHPVLFRASFASFKAIFRYTFPPTDTGYTYRNINNTMKILRKARRGKYLELFKNTTRF